MRHRCRNIRFSLFILAASLLAACQAPVRTEKELRYTFPAGVPLIYNLDMEMDTSADAGIFQYKGIIRMTGRFELTKIMTNTPYGERVQMVLRDLDIQAEDPRIRAGIMLGMNFFRSYFAYLYFSPQGRVQVLHGTRPQPELSSYASMLFPDFSQPALLWQGYTADTNFVIRLQDTPYRISISQSDQPAALRAREILFNRRYLYRLYQEKDYQTSVDPQPIATIDTSFRIAFDPDLERITSVQADVLLNLAYPMEQGILVQNITLQSRGKALILPPTETLP